MYCWLSRFFSDQFSPVYLLRPWATIAQLPATHIVKEKLSKSKFLKGRVFIGDVGTCPPWRWAGPGGMYGLPRTLCYICSGAIGITLCYRFGLNAFRYTRDKRFAITYGKASVTHLRPITLLRTRVLYVSFEGSGRARDIPRSA